MVLLGLFKFFTTQLHYDGSIWRNWSFKFRIKRSFQSVEVPESNEVVKLVETTPTFKNYAWNLSIWRGKNLQYLINIIQKKNILKDLILGK